jgi:hypothetical protein
MDLSIQQMPTLGYFNKTICDCLGLWSSDRKDVLFNVPATEKERIKALDDAFTAIKRDDGSYGTLDELVLATTNLSPVQRKNIKKNKTIQDYTNFLSKEDFSSHHELIEISNYIHIIIEDKYNPKELSAFISKLHTSSIMYYKEFIREHTVKVEEQLNSYIFFIKNIFINLIDSFADDTSINFCSTNNDSTVSYINEWPLRSFVDSIAEICNVSLYNLNQFHEIRLNNKTYTDKEIWDIDFKSQPVNSRSKQVIDRLKKKNKIKWDTLYDIIKPLAYLLPEGADKENFTINLYSAFFIHNINNHIREIDVSDPTRAASCQKWHYPLIQGQCSWTPITDKIDFMLNNVELTDTTAVQTLIERYRDLTKMLRLTSSSLLNNFEALGTLEFSYSKQFVEFPIEALSHKLGEVPRWLDEWYLARCEVTSDNPPSALQHYKNALKLSKYLSGSLYVPLYLEICAFCKYQYKELKNRNEEELFDRFYEPLGSEAAKYAMLLGYSPSFSRDPKTLVPKSDAPKKNKLLLDKIDSMASLLA